MVSLVREAFLRKLQRQPVPDLLHFWSRASGMSRICLLSSQAKVTSRYSPPTSSIPEAQVGESPDVAEADGVTDDGQHEVQLAAPLQQTQLVLTLDHRHLTSSLSPPSSTAATLLSSGLRRTCFTSLPEHPAISVRISLDSKTCSPWGYHSALWYTCDLRVPILYHEFKSTL